LLLSILLTKASGGEEMTKRGSREADKNKEGAVERGGGRGSKERGGTPERSGLSS